MAGKGKKPIAIGTIEEVEGEIRLRLKAITHIKRVMERRKLKEIQAMGRPMVTRGLREIDRFIYSCKRDLGEL